MNVPPFILILLGAVVLIALVLNILKPKIKGKFGELKVSWQLNRLYYKKYKVINDVLIRDNSLLLNWSLSLLVIFALTYWLINIIWAVISLRSYNQKIEEEAMRQNDFWQKHYASTPNQVVVNINQNTSGVNTSGQQKSEVTTKPNIQDWLKSNPGKTINDYFTKFGR